MHSLTQDCPCPLPNRYVAEPTHAEAVSEATEEGCGIWFRVEPRFAVVNSGAVDIRHIHHPLSLRTSTHEQWRTRRAGRLRGQASTG